MTALQNQYNQLLLDRAKLEETARANRASESIRSREASASAEQARAAVKKANVEEGRLIFGNTGPLSLIANLLGTILKASL